MHNRGVHPSCDVHVPAHLQVNQTLHLQRREVPNHTQLQQPLVLTSVNAGAACHHGGATQLLNLRTSVRMPYPLERCESEGGYQSY